MQAPPQPPTRPAVPKPWFSRRTVAVKYLPAALTKRLGTAQAAEDEGLEEQPTTPSAQGQSTTPASASRRTLTVHCLPLLLDSDDEASEDMNSEVAVAPPAGNRTLTVKCLRVALEDSAEANPISEVGDADDESTSRPCGRTRTERRCLPIFEQESGQASDVSKDQDFGEKFTSKTCARTLTLKLLPKISFYSSEDGDLQSMPSLPSTSARTPPSLHNGAAQLLAEDNVFTFAEFAEWKTEQEDDSAAWSPMRDDSLLQPGHSQHSEAEEVVAFLAMAKACDDVRSKVFHLEMDDRDTSLIKLLRRGRASWSTSTRTESACWRRRRRKKKKKEKGKKASITGSPPKRFSGILLREKTRPTASATSWWPCRAGAAEARPLTPAQPLLRASPSRRPPTATESAVALPVHGSWRP